MALPACSHMEGLAEGPGPKQGKHKLLVLLQGPVGPAQVLTLLTHSLPSVRRTGREEHRQAKEKGFLFSPSEQQHGNTPPTALCACLAPESSWVQATPVLVPTKKFSEGNCPPPTPTPYLVPVVQEGGDPRAGR